MVKQFGLYYTAFRLLLFAIKLMSFFTNCVQQPPYENITSNNKYGEKIENDSV